jgi:hypothetical protein
VYKCEKYPILSYSLHFIVTLDTLLKDHPVCPFFRRKVL